MTGSPLLITSSVVVHAPLTVLTDPAKRLAYTIEALGKWMQLGRPIVLCDGSGFDFSAVVAAALPGAPIECLSFHNDQAMVRQRGKGWGEGEIIRYALAHSAQLAAAENFAKCTSKLFVRNFAELLRYWNGRFVCDARFRNVPDPRRAVSLGSVDTRFYLASRSFYQEHLLDAHLGVDDISGVTLEHRFGEAVETRHLPHVIFGSMPIIEGMSGGRGTLHPMPTVRRRYADRLRRAIVGLRTDLLAPRHGKDGLAGGAF